MALNLHDAVDGDGLFDILGKFWNVLDLLNDVVASTIPAAAQSAVDQFKLLTPSDASYEVAASGLSASVISWQNTPAILSSQVRRNSENLVREFCRHDANVASMSLTDALDYLVADMEAAGAYVTPNVVGMTITPAGTNAGDSTLCATTLRGDGRVQENTPADSIEFEVLGMTPAVRPSITVKGTPSQSNLLSHAWPQGSGVSTTITPTDPAASLLTNGNFETVDDNELPSLWIVTTGTAGATIWVTTVQEQTITIANTPGAGYYFLYYEDPAGTVWATAALAYNATGPQVQIALRALPGLSQVTVTTTGTSPNYTHTVTMTGVAGNPTKLTSGNFLTPSYGYSSPTISHAISVAGDAYSYKGRALRLESDGAELTTLYHALTLTPRRVYFLHCRMCHVGTGAGEVRIELVDGIDGDVIDDEAGSANELVIDEGDLSASHSAHWFSFRIPPTVSQVYLRVRIATAFPAGDRVYLDEMAISAGTQLYAGGPWVAMFAGALTHQYGDSWTLALTNTRAGEVQEWFHRIFQAGSREIVLPSTGSTLIPNSVIA